MEVEVTGGSSGEVDGGGLPRQGSSEVGGGSEGAVRKTWCAGRNSKAGGIAATAGRSAVSAQEGEKR